MVIKSLLIVLIVFLCSCGKDKVTPQAFDEMHTGACYSVISDNPFDEPPIEYVVTIKGKYYQYRYYLGSVMGYSILSSRRVGCRKYKHEVPCPPTIWGDGINIFN